MKFITGLLYVGFLITSFALKPNENVESIINLIGRDIVNGIKDVSDNIYNCVSHLTKEGTSFVDLALSQSAAQQTTADTIIQLIRKTHNDIDKHINFIVSSNRRRISTDSIPLGWKAVPFLKQLDLLATNTIHQIREFSTLVENTFTDEINYLVQESQNGTKGQVLADHVHNSISGLIRQIESSNLLIKFENDVDKLIASLQQIGSLSPKITNNLSAHIDLALSDSLFKAKILKNTIQNSASTIISTLTQLA